MTIRSSMNSIDPKKYERIFGKNKKAKKGTYVWRNGKFERYVHEYSHEGAYIIPDNYDAKSFVTADITGTPVEIESRSQERKLCKQNKTIRREKGMGRDDKRVKYREKYKTDMGGLKFEWTNARRNRRSI